MRWSAVGVALALSLGLAAPRSEGVEGGRPDRKPLPRAEALAARGVSEGDQSLLEKRKVLVTNEAWKQVFSPYLERDFPIFVTADAVLNGYHGLLEESLARREAVNAASLPRVLSAIWDRLGAATAASKADPVLLSRAARRARLVLGVAVRLAGGAAPGAPALDAAIGDEVRRVEEATGVSLPEWLGPARADFSGIDHGRFLPRGLHGGDDRLRRHFRAVAWLQAIPFRISSDEELLSILLLGDAASGRSLPDPADRRALEDVLRGNLEFLGPCDDFDLLRAAEEAEAGGDLDGIRKRMRAEAARLGGPRISDSVTRAPPTDPPVVAEPGFRIVAASRTVDGVHFQRTTDIRRFSPQRLPTGLEIAAALGSRSAREGFAVPAPPDKRRADLLADVDALGPLVAADTTLRGEYLRCIAALLDAPDTGAPTFASGDAWNAKGINAALAGWAQMRHASLLQERTSASYGAFLEIEPGFVEPDPEFFARFGALVRRTAALLAPSGILDPSKASVALQLEDLADQLERNGFLQERRYGEWGANQGRAELALNAMGALDRDPFGAQSEGNARVLAEIRKLAVDFRSGALDRHPKFAAVIAYLGGDFRVRWDDLAKLVARLETMARKELNAEPFDAAEQSFLRVFGQRLGRILGYAGNSYLEPRDDSPRVADVFADPTRGKVVLVGTDRPRTIYVLYPVGDREVLCRGAILPYVEFTGTKAMDDVAYRELLDGDARPATQTWISPLLGEEGIRKAVPRER